MSELPEKLEYDVQFIVPAESLHEAIEAVSHLKGVVFQVTIRKPEQKREHY